MGTFIEIETRQAEEQAFYKQSYCWGKERWAELLSTMWTGMIDWNLKDPKCHSVLFAYQFSSRGLLQLKHWRETGRKAERVLIISRSLNPKVPLEGITHLIFGRVIIGVLKLSNSPVPTQVNSWFEKRSSPYPRFLKKEMVNLFWGKMFSISVYWLHV